MIMRRLYAYPAIQQSECIAYVIHQWHYAPMTTPVRPIRISDEEVEDALKKGKEYGQHDISKVVRLALKLLPYPKRK